MKHLVKVSEANALLDEHLNICLLLFFIIIIVYYYCIFAAMHFGDLIYWQNLRLYETTLCLQWQSELYWIYCN